MNKQEIQEFIKENIEYKNWDFFVGDKNGIMFLQIRFNAPDNFTGETERQHCRKFQLSEWMTKTEIVQTCWLAVTRAELHESAENFLYKGQTIFNTHIDVDGLAEICELNKFEHRGEPVI